MTHGPGRADHQGPAGNLYDKYGTRNPAARAVVARFLRELDALVMNAEPAEVLDVGCGEGVVTERIAALLPGRPVTGVDVDAPALEASWRGRAGGTLAFRPGSAYSLPFDDGDVDLVCAVEVMEHLERPGEALAEMARVARRGIILTTPREPLWRIANVATGRHLRSLGDTPGHVNHWSRRGLVRLAATRGRVAEVRTPPPWTMVRLDLTRSGGAAGG